MSYEYKDYFKELNFNESRKVGSDLNDRFNARDELNEVYSQAAKVDEYEAKAKLADDIITAWKTGNFDFTEGEGSLPDHGIAPVPNYHIFDFGQYVDSLLDEYESGESNELRE